MKRKQKLLALLALVLVLSACLHPALAYFTTRVQAKGGYTIHMGSTTTIEEDFKDWMKTVVISNKAGSKPVFIRAQAYAASQSQPVTSGTGWTGPDAQGWYYYGPTLPGGGSTEPLYVKINNVPAAEEELQFNVVVVYESTPVQYDETGKPYPDWTMKIGGSQG